VNIGQTGSEIILLKGFIISKIRGVHADNSLKPRCHWTDIHRIYRQYSQNARLSQMNPLKSEWRYCNLFPNSRTRAYE